MTSSSRHSRPYRPLKSRDRRIHIQFRARQTPSPHHGAPVQSRAYVHVVHIGRRPNQAFPVELGISCAYRARARPGGATGWRASLQTFVNYRQQGENRNCGGHQHKGRDAMSSISAEQDWPIRRRISWIHAAICACCDPPHHGNRRPSCSSAYEKKRQDKYVTHETLSSGGAAPGRTHACAAAIRERPSCRYDFNLCIARCPDPIIQLGGFFKVADR